MTTYNLPNTTSFQFDVDSGNDTATLGSGTGSGIVMGTGDDIVYLGGQDQSVTIGDGTGVPGSETIVVGTDGSAAHNVVADSAAGELETANINALGGNGTLMIEGGTTATSAGVLLEADAIYLQRDYYTYNEPGYQNGIANVVIDNSATYLIDVNEPVDTDEGPLVKGTNITAGNGNNTFDLENYSYASIDTLTAGNGNNSVVIGGDAYNDTVSLGSGVNTVAIDYSSDLFVGSQINGGSGASNTLTLETDSSSDPAVMGAGVIGFATLNVGADFGDALQLVTNTTDAPLTVDGTATGYDNVTLSGTGQSYVGNSGYVAADGPVGANTVTLTGGSIGAGVTLNGGLQSNAVSGSALILASTNASGANDYNFNAANVSNFSTVVLLDSNATLDLNSASYTVDIDPSSNTPLINLVGGSGNNVIDIFRGGGIGKGSINQLVSNLPSVEVFQSGSVIDGGTGSSNELIIGGESQSFLSPVNFYYGQGNDGDYQETTLEPTADVDLSKAAVSGFDSVVLENGSTLTLTSAQIMAIDQYAESVGVDPNGVFQGQSGSTLVVDVSPGTTNLNIADLHLGQFEQGFDNTLEVVDANSTNDTIYGGSGTETIDLSGTGNYWVNAGSGDDTILVGASAGTHSVFIDGNDGSDDTIVFTNSSSTPLQVGDTLVGPEAGSGSGVVEVSGAIDFTKTTFANFSSYETIDIDSNSTGIFTLEQVHSDVSSGIPFTAVDRTSVLEILADSNTTNSFSSKSTGEDSADFSANVATEVNAFAETGVVDLHVTGYSAVSSSPVIVDATTFLGDYNDAADVEIDANSGFATLEGSGYNTQITVNHTGDGGTSTGTGGALDADDTFYFDVTNAGSTFNTLDTIDLAVAQRYYASGALENQGDYSSYSDQVDGGTVTNTLEVGANTNFVGATINGTFNTIEIAAGVTATLTEEQIGGSSSAPVVVYDYSTNPSSAADLTITVDANFSQSDLNVTKDPNTSPEVYDYAETLNVTGATTGKTVDLSAQPSNSYLITVNEATGASGNTFKAGLGSEDLYGSTGSDTFLFDSSTNPVGQVPFNIADIVNGGGGADTLQVGDGSTAVNDDFRKSTITEVEQFNVSSHAEAVFNSTQLDGYNVATASGGSLVVHLTEPSDSFSLVTGKVSNVSTTADFNLANSGSTILIDNMTGPNSIYAGAGNELIFDGQSSDSIYAGTGNDMIVVRDGAGGNDNLFGNASSGSSVVFEFTFDGGTDTYAPGTSTATATNLMTGVVNDGAPSSWHVGSGSAVSFHEQNGTINGGSGSASIDVDSDVDFSRATISNISSGSESIYVAAGDAAVFTNTQLAAFSTAGDKLAAGSSSSALVIDVATNGFSGSTLVNGNATALSGWTGSVTVDGVSNGQSSGQTIDVSNLTGSFHGWTDTINGGAETGAYVYGAAGDTINIGSASGEYVQDGGSGATIVVTGGNNDYLAAGGGSNNTIAFESTTSSTPIDAAGDVLRGGGSSGETLEIGGASASDQFGYAIFDGNSAFSNTLSNASDAALIRWMNNIEFNNGTGSGTYEAEFSYQQLLTDELNLTSVNTSYQLGITETDSSPSNSTAIMTVKVDGSGDMDLRWLNTTGFGAYDQGGGAATIDIYDNNTSSVTVFGTENGTSSPGLEAGDSITVQGLGDSVVLGSGANSVNFLSQNVANDVQFLFANLNGGNSLAAQGSIIQGLSDNNAGYVDLTGYGETAGATGGVLSSSGTDLGVAFKTSAVVEDAEVLPGNSSDGHIAGGELLSSSGVISNPGISAAALAIEENFTDASHAAVSGFVTETDGNGDIALFLVQTTGAGAGSHVQAADLSLLGVFQGAQAANEVTAKEGAVSSSFFHIH